MTKHKREKMKLMYSLITCCGCLLLLTVSLAWFVMEINPKDTQGAIIPTGNIALEAALYIGNDKDKNGVLEKDANDNYFTVLDSQDLKSISNCFSRAKITYKAVVTNNNEYPVDVSLSYAKLNKYFFDIVENNLTVQNGEVVPLNSTQTEELEGILKDNSARMMFKFNILGHSDESISEEPTDTYNLFDISNGEPFFQNVTIPTDGTEEFYFQLERISFSEFSTDYRTFWDNYISNQANNVSGDDAIKIRYLYAKELEYIVQNSNRTDNHGDYLKFTIDYVSVGGVQHVE